MSNTPPDKLDVEMERIKRLMATPGPGKIADFDPDKHPWHGREASKRLKQLGFDPIAEMVETYDQVVRDIARLTHFADGTPKDGSKTIRVWADDQNVQHNDSNYYSKQLLANLITIKQKCVNDLLRYGYARTPETLELDHKATEPIQFILNKKA